MSIRKTEGEIAPILPMSTTPPSRSSTPSGGKLAQYSAEISSSSTSGAQSSLSSVGESSRSSGGESFISSEVLCSSAQSAVFISMTGRNDELYGVFDWFLLDDESQGKILDPIIGSQPGSNRLFCVTAFGSAIYVLGGANMSCPSRRPALSSDVYYVDTCKPGEGWKKGASLLKPRGFGFMYAGVMNGKIYIWGDGLKVDIPRTGEVFDPTLNSWSELQHPTLDIPPPLELHAVWEEQNRFLFQSTETKDLYVYDAEQDSWALYDSSYGRRRNKAAVVGEIMYVFHKGEVHAYDLDKRKWFKKAVANLRNQRCLPPAHGPLSKEGTLLHLGNGRLCLIWDQDVGDLKHVHCIKFAVCKERYEHRLTLVASAVSSSVFYIKGDRILESCLALGPKSSMAEHTDHTAVPTPPTSNPNSNRARQRAMRKTQGEIAPLLPVSSTSPSRSSSSSGQIPAQSSLEKSSSSSGGESLLSSYSGGSGESPLSSSSGGEPSSSSEDELSLSLSSEGESSWSSESESSGSSEGESSWSSEGESSGSSGAKSFISSEVLCSSAQAAVFISMTGRNDERYRVFDWFLLDDESQGKILDPIIGSQPGSNRLFCVTAFGSAIYVLGGANMSCPSRRRALSSDVYYVDTCKLGEGWKKGVSLLKPRGFGFMYAGVMNGKIYIWGNGLKVDIPRTGEVFDPTLNSWSELQHPTLDIPPPLELHAVWEEQNRFLFKSAQTKDLYVYDAEQDSWALYDSSYGRRRNKAAVVGEIMYVFHKGEVHAYDLDKRKWFKKAVANLRNQGCLPPAHGPLSKEGTLLHLGNGRLCLIWDQDVGDLKHVHCIKFAVCKERYEHRLTLVASAVSSSVFYIKGDRILESCLAL